MDLFFTLRIAVLFSLITVSCATHESSGPLTIYWIDVEGGAATLIVTPAGESVLMDAGFETDDDRDALRIMAAIEDAGISTIDYFIGSHYHFDHVAGLPALAKRIPISRFIDHGENLEPNNERTQYSWDNYISVAGDQRRTVKPGDDLALSGVSFSFVTSARKVIDPGKEMVNPYCEGASEGVSVEGENDSSLGYLLSLGNFDFLNLGDLTVNIQHKLACPANRIGIIDLYQVPHHGNGIAPQLSLALSPTAAVINNGPHKGGSPEGYDGINIVPDVKIWQVHRALDTDDVHNTTVEMTANLTEEDDEGFWIKATVQADGEGFVIENGRNGFMETYDTK